MEFWEQTFYDNSLRDWGVSLLIVIGAILLNQLIAFLFRKIIMGIKSKNATYFDGTFFAALEKPLVMGIMLLAIWIAASRLQIEKEVFSAIEKSYGALVVLNITWFFARFAGALVEEDTSDNRERTKRRRFRIDAKLYPLVKRTIIIVIWLIGIIMAINNAGVHVTTLLSTLGIGGIAFALAAQDTIKNMFGGITIYTDKPFRIGDIIKVDAIEGTVIDIGLRSTRILNYDKRVMTIPNFKLMDSIITNISSEIGRRIVSELGLTYDTSLEKMLEAMEILKDMPNRVPEIHKDNLVVSFTEFAESALIITFIYFIAKKANIYDTRSKVNQEILRAFNEAGLQFAFPTRTVYNIGRN